MKKLLALLLCICSAPAFGAFGSGSIWRVSTVSSSDSNGGAFDPGVGSPGTDESTSAGVAITVTLTAATTGTCSPACTSTTHGPGNFIRIASGTGCTTGTTYEILSQSGGTITVDKNMGSNGNACVGVIGGPLASPTTASGRLAASNTMCIKSDGSYTITTQINPTAGAVNAPTVVQGYTTTCPTNDGTQATLVASGNIFMYNTTGGDFQLIRNLIFNCNNSGGGAEALNINSNNIKGDNLLMETCPASPIKFQAGSGFVLTNTRITNSGSAGCVAGIEGANAGSITLFGVLIDTNSCPGITTGSSTQLTCINSISANNTGASSDGFQITNGANNTLLFDGCTAYGNGRDGIRFTNANGPANAIIRNSWFWGNSGKAINATTSAASDALLTDYNGYVSSGLTGVTAGAHDVTLTTDPSNNGAGLDFSLNSTTGGGAALSEAGFPGVFFNTTGHGSIGPAQPKRGSPSSVAFAQ